MTLSERIEARKPKPKDEPRKPEWLRRKDEGKLPAKELVG